MAEKVTIETVRKGYPEIVSKIEEETKKPLQEKIDSITQENIDLQKKIDDYGAKEERRKVDEGIRKTIIEKAKSFEVPESELTESRISRVLPWLREQDEKERDSAVEEMVKEWKPTTAAPKKKSVKKNLGTRQDVTESNQRTDNKDENSVQESNDDEKPEGYIPLDVKEAAKVISN